MKINYSTLNGLLGQLIDLKSGHLKEIVITNNEYLDLLIVIIGDRIEAQKELEQAERDEARLEELKQEDLEEGKRMTDVAEEIREQHEDFGRDNLV